MEEVKTGTTTVGVVTNNGIVFAADKRATAGSIVIGKEIEKVIPVTDNIVITISGLVGDCQKLAEWLKAELKLYEIRNGRKASVKTAATILSNILYGNRFYMPYYVQLLLGGYDSDFHLFSIGADGSTVEHKYMSTGSGSTFALGVLDNEYSKSMNKKEAIDIAKKAVNIAMGRDIYSGEGITIYYLSRKGLEKVA
ncbi:proteasome subunit beta [Nanoarchaeota archaeon]|nr:MAG: proteasome subunit beta [Nanoarchaeota archaeon]